MFSKLASRNSKRSRKENGLFFASLIISIVAFYIILSLSQQDVMRFLQQMESDAVNRLLAMIPVFYGMTLVILFFLIYFACKFQLERRRHEFGVYLMLGMRRMKLFFLLLAEDFRSSIFSLLIGLPIAVLLSELISLITAKLVGLGIIGHHSSLSWTAILWTILGFLAIKLAAFLILSGKISRQEIQSLLVDTPEGTKRQLPTLVYALSLGAGILLLGFAYYMAICGIAWQANPQMALTLVFGLIGTLLLFFGLRFLMQILLKAGNGKLHVFNFRQLEENVIHQSHTMAVSSLLILAALCCFGAGVSIAQSYSQSEPHVLDYTFTEPLLESGEAGADEIIRTLKHYQLDSAFSSLFQMKVGHIHTTEAPAFVMDAVMDALKKQPASNEKDILLNNLSYVDSPYLISLSGYNELLTQAGLPTLRLAQNEAAIYIDTEFLTPKRTQILNEILSDRPKTLLGGAPLYLTESVQTTSLVTDRSITLSFALILPDAAFSYYTQDRYSVYVNGILNQGTSQHISLMNAISDMNEKLKQTGLSYESYLQNMGRQLFYIVASSYITIYLAIIFLIIANTIIGVQFLMRQQKTNRRYQTLIRLGATYKDLCQSANKQIYWYFGIPTLVAALSSLLGVKALLSGLLSSSIPGYHAAWIPISSAMILLLCMIEYIYITAVTRSSSRYLLTLMVPEREE